MRREYVNPSYNDPSYGEPRRVDPHGARIKALGSGRRTWQLEAFEKIKDARFSFIIAACGSGKTILQIALSIYEVIRSKWTIRQLILVPQQHIGKPFCEDIESEAGYVAMRLCGKEYQWMPENFCDDTKPEVISRLREWLLRDISSFAKYDNDTGVIRGICAVASHQAMALVWKSLNDAEKKRVIRNLRMRGDEAHHISGIYSADLDGLTEEEREVVHENATTLGNICRHIFNSGDQTSRLCLTTATPYRGDGKPMLSQKAAQKFKDGTYVLDFIEHFQTLGIKTVTFTYEEYDRDPILHVLNNILAEPNEKHLVVVPSMGQKWRTIKKLDDLMAALRLRFGERMLDLVTPSTQAQNKRLLLSEPKSFGKESKFDVVVTCMLGREGTDWCPCSRLHNTACENTPTLAVQTVGRPFRRFRPDDEESLAKNEGKTNVAITYYVHRFPCPRNGLTKRELLSDRTNAMLILMQFEELFNPMLLPKLPSHGKRGRRVSLADMFGDQYQNVKRELMEAFLETQDETAVEDVLDKYGYLVGKDDKKVVAGVLRAILVRMMALGKSGKKGNGHAIRMLLDIGFVRENGLDLIIEKNDLDRSLFFANFGKKEFDIARRIYKTRMSETEHYAKCEQIRLVVQRCCLENPKGGFYDREVERLEGDMEVAGREFKDRNDWHLWKKRHGKK